MQTMSLLGSQTVLGLWQYKESRNVAARSRDPTRVKYSEQCRRHGGRRISDEVFFGTNNDQLRRGARIDAGARAAGLRPRPWVDHVLRVRAGKSCASAKNNDISVTCRI
jgi:hypothetical protein